MCKAAYPEGIDKNSAFIVLIINVISPGIGTCIAGCLAPKFRCSTVAVGVVQLLLFPLIVGWIWAIVWSVGLVKAADEDRQVTGGQTNQSKQGVSQSHHTADVPHHNVSPPPPLAAHASPPPLHSHNPQGVGLGTAGVPPPPTSGFAPNVPPPPPPPPASQY